MANKSLCGVCFKKIIIKNTTKLCINCNKPIHQKCSKRTKSEYFKEIEIFCTSCIEEYFPFSRLNEDEFLFNVINGSTINLAPDLGILPNASQKRFSSY